VDRESQLSRRTRRTTRRGGQREEEDNERRRRGEEEEEDQATDIKSNNPHLAGGEKRTFSKTIPWETLMWMLNQVMVSPAESK